MKENTPIKITGFGWLIGSFIYFVVLDSIEKAIYSVLVAIFFTLFLLLPSDD